MGESIPRGGVAALILLTALSVNAVMVQTITSEEDSALKTLVRLGALVFAGLVILTRQIPVDTWVMLAVLYSLIALLSRSNTDQLSIVFVLVATVMLRGFSDRLVLRAAVASSLVALGLIFIFLQVGLTQSETVLTAVLGQQPRERENFGTASVPFFYNVVYGATVLTILYARKYGSSWLFSLSLFLGLASGTYFYIQTDVRGGFYSLLLFVAMLVVVPLTRRLGSVQILVSLMPLWFLLLAALTAAAASSVTFNLLLSTRPSLYRAFLADIGLADILFSTSVKQFDKRVATVFTVDNSYLHLLVGAGAVVFLGFIVVCYRAARSMYSEQRYADIAFVIATLIYCNSEGILLRIELVFIVYLWYLLIRSATRVPRSSRRTASTRRRALHRPSDARPGIGVGR